MPHTGFMRSGLVTALLLASLSLAFGFVWRAHQRARFHQLTAKVLPPNPGVPSPGGQQAVVLSRLTLLNNTAPEFVSTTLLPGWGMEFLQLTMAVPNRGTRNLLAAPSLAEAAFSASGLVTSGLFHLHVSTRREPHAKLLGEPDLMGFSPAQQATNRTTADGGEAAGNFPSAGAEQASSGVEAESSVVFTGRALDVTVRLKNTSDANRYALLEWEPQFAAPDADLHHLALSIPSTARTQAAGTASHPGGGTDFSSGDSRALEDRDSDVTYSALKREFLADGPVMRLSYLEDGVTLRISALSPMLRSVHVRTEAKTHVLALGLTSSDPSAGNGDEPEMVLRPGQTVLWRLRLEIVSTDGDTEHVFRHR